VAQARVPGEEKAPLQGWSQGWGREVWRCICPLELQGWQAEEALWGRVKGGDSAVSHKGRNPLEGFMQVPSNPTALDGTVCAARAGVREVQGSVHVGPHMHMCKYVHASVCGHMHSCLCVLTLWWVEWP
jgi:hypothetical protein